MNLSAYLFVFLLIGSLFTTHVQLNAVTLSENSDGAKSTIPNVLYDMNKAAEREEERKKRYLEIAEQHLNNENKVVIFLGVTTVTFAIAVIAGISAGISQSSKKIE